MASCSMRTAKSATTRKISLFPRTAKAPDDESGASLLRMVSGLYCGVGMRRASRIVSMASPDSTWLVAKRSKR